MFCSPHAQSSGEDASIEEDSALVAGNYQPPSYFRSRQQTPTVYGPSYGRSLEPSGKAQYLTGTIQAPNFGKHQHRTDNFARLYRPYVVSSRDKRHWRISSGMNGIYNWLNYLDENFRFEFGQFLGRGGTIRAAKPISMISSGNVDWQTYRRW